MFNDQRSKKVILVAHCILNQNAKIDRCARYPGAMRELAGFLVESGVGIVQLPCPELLCLGLDREADPRRAGTVESEDTRVARRMRDGVATTFCDRLAEDIAVQVREYQQNGFEVLGVIGINGSPTCGVETNWSDDEESPGPGVFMQALQKRVAAPVRGVKAANPQDAVVAAKALVAPE